VIEVPPERATERRRVLVLHPALAPYRIDMFNALARACTLELAFLEANVRNQGFDQARLRALLEVEPRYLLGGITVGERALRPGIDRLIRRFRPDVVVTTEFGPATATVLASRALRRAAFPLVVSTEDNPSSVRQDTRVHALGRRALLSFVDAVLVYSEEARALYRERFGARQPVVASALVQSEVVMLARLARAGEAASAEARARGLLGHRVLLYVGRLAPEKRVDRLIDAFARIRAAVPALVLAIVGDGPDRAALEARAGAAAPAGAVIFAGRLEGVRLDAWYRLGSAFALASDHEPFGAVVNEALVAGMPVVCSDRAGARVLVAPGQNGAVVDASRPSDLDAALLEWLRRQPPLSDAQLEATRPSLMRTTFADAVAAYLEALEAALQYRSRR
jgi:glycosyltransferase involved in cell wall biosynthesis